MWRDVSSIDVVCLIGVRINVDFFGKKISNEDKYSHSVNENLSLMNIYSKLIARVVSVFF